MENVRPPKHNNVMGSPFKMLQNGISSAHIVKQALQPQLVVQVAGWMKESKTRRRNNRNKANRRKLREEEALIAEKKILDDLQAIFNAQALAEVQMQAEAQMRAEAQELAKAQFNECLARFDRSLAPLENFAMLQKQKEERYLLGSLMMLL